MNKFAKTAVAYGLGALLALHAGPQRRAERTAMGAHQLKRGPTVEKARTDNLQDVDGTVEQIARDNRELIIAGAVFPQRIGRMHEQGNIEIDGGLSVGIGS